MVFKRSCHSASCWAAGSWLVSCGGGGTGRDTSRERRRECLPPAMCAETEHAQSAFVASREVGKEEETNTCTKSCLPVSKAWDNRIGLGEVVWTLWPHLHPGKLGLFRNLHPLAWTCACFCCVCKTEAERYQEISIARVLGNYLPQRVVFHSTTWKEWFFTKSLEENEGKSNLF